MSSMDTSLAKIVGNRKCKSVFRVILVVIAVMIVEPHLLFAWPHVLGSDFLECFVDSLIAVFHRLYGICCEGYTSSDFCEVGRLFIDCYWYATAVESNA